MKTIEFEIKSGFIAGLILSYIILSLVIGMLLGVNNDCTFISRITYYNPFYRGGCWLTEPYYVYKDPNAYDIRK